MNLFKTLAIVGLVILFGIGCYIAGSYVSTKKIIRGFNVGNLLWITEINRQIELQNNQKAEELCFSTAQGNFSVLNRLDKDALLYSIMAVCPWTNPMDERTMNILTKAKIFYAPKASKMFPDAREYLNSIKEVPITTTCKLPTNNPSPTPQ
jgi:hypothetical protein